MQKNNPTLLIFQYVLCLSFLFFAEFSDAQEITEKDKEQQEEVLKENPRDFGANFVVGAFYYNLAVDPHLETTKMNLVEYLEDGETLEKQKENFLKKALPYFENAYTLQSNGQVKEVLKEIYQNLGIIPAVRAKDEEIEASLNKKLESLDFKVIE